MKTRLLVIVSLQIYLALNYSDSFVMLLEPVWVSFLVAFTLKLKGIYFSSQIKLCFPHGDQVKATRTDNSLSHYQGHLKKMAINTCMPLLSPLSLHVQPRILCPENGTNINKMLHNFSVAEINITSKATYRRGIYLGLCFQRSNSPPSSQGYGRRSWSIKMKAHILKNKHEA